MYYSQKKIENEAKSNLIDLDDQEDFHEL